MTNGLKAAKEINSRVFKEDEHYRNDDVSIIQSSMIRLLDKSDELSSKLNNTMPVCKERFLYNLLAGHVHSIDQMKEEFKNYNCCFPFEDYHVAVFEINEIANFDEKYNENEIFLFKNSIIKLLLELLDNERNGYFSEIQEKRIALAYHTIKGQEDNFYIKLENIRDQIIKELDISIAIGIGEYAGDLLSFMCDVKSVPLPISNSIAVF